MVLKKLSKTLSLHRIFGSTSSSWFTYCNVEFHPGDMGGGRNEVDWRDEYSVWIQLWDTRVYHLAGFLINQHPTYGIRRTLQNFDFTLHLWEHQFILIYPLWCWVFFHHFLRKWLSHPLDRVIFLSLLTVNHIRNCRVLVSLRHLNSVLKNFI